MSDLKQLQIDAEAAEYESEEIWTEVARLTAQARKARGRGLPHWRAIFAKRDRLAREAREVSSEARDARKKSPLPPPEMTPEVAAVSIELQQAALLASEAAQKAMAMVKELQIDRDRLLAEIAKAKLAAAAVSGSSEPTG